jgi:diphosphomevalonate decarboxylase
MHPVKPEGIVSWQSPSNIAIIKYWGKHGIQLPKNPSFSLTLSKALTQTKAKYQIREGKGRNISVSLDGVDQPAFIPKISQFFDRISPEYSFLDAINIQFETHNSFPHSSGIASSASAMSALALIVAEIAGKEHDMEEVSRLARLGSGSAARSVFPFGSVWGISRAIEASSDYFAVGMGDHMHPVFKTFRDAILIVKSGAKSVSSTAGHGLMNAHPFAEKRYQLARERMIELADVLKNGDVLAFGVICEKEALELHALMMCSNPPYMLLEPHTVEMINRIQAFRKLSKVPAFFTLDAGPNIHLLYPDAYKNQVKDFISTELVAFCEKGKWIDDQVGTGPAKIKIA